VLSVQKRWSSGTVDGIMRQPQIRTLFCALLFWTGTGLVGQTAPAPAASDQSSCIPQLAQVASSGLYHFILGIKSGDSIWVDPLPETTTQLAWYWRIDKDAGGRVVQALSMHEERLSQSSRYFYAGDATDPCRVEGYNQNGQLTEIDINHRDAAGNIVRTDEEDPTGKLTGYEVRTYDQDGVDDTEYEAGGRLIQHVTYFYGSTGRMNGRAIYPGGSPSTAQYLLQEVSEKDGLIRITHQYRDGKLQFTMKYIFGPQGQMTHSDTYTTDGYLAVTQDWHDGLVTDRTYHLPDGGSREFRFFLDNNRDPSTTDVYINGVLLCTMKYSKQAPGQFATKIYGVDGKLWASYPPPTVGDLERDGQPTGRHDGVIYKKGFWW
jgi:hypothetical protein